MKKAGFVIAETVLSLVLAASVASVAFLAIDLKTNQFHLDKYNPFASQNSEASEKPKAESSAPKSSKPEESSKKSSQTSREESSKTEESSQQSKEESSKPEHVETIKLVSEPQDLKSNPKELEDALKAYGFSLGTAISGNRVIFIDTNGTDDIAKAKLYCYEKSTETGFWWNVAGDGKPLSTDVYIGEKGSNFMPEYDSKVTPGGILPLGSGFYIDDKPNTEYDMFKITEDTYWITDPNSEYYNQKVEGTENKDWSSADHMITSSDSYRYGLVIEYNTVRTEAKYSSAIFMQCGGTPTEGSIAVPENVMKTILEWFDKDTSATIFISV